MKGSTKSGTFGSKNVPTHLARGLVGFGPLAAAFALTPALGPVSLLLAPVGLIALRGCPMCWVMGLAETISNGRLRRVCENGTCTLEHVDRSSGLRVSPGVDDVSEQSSRVRSAA